MESYVREGGINHVDGKNLPSKHAIAIITADLLRLLFPGFFDEKPIHFSEIEAVTSALLDSVLGRLENEITKSLEYAPPAGLGGRGRCTIWRARSRSSSWAICPEFENCSRPTRRRLTTATRPLSARTK